MIVKTGAVDKYVVKSFILFLSKVNKSLAIKKDKSQVYDSLDILII